MESYGFAFHDIRVNSSSAGHRIVDMDPSVDVLDGKIHWMRGEGCAERTLMGGKG